MGEVVGRVCRVTRVGNGAAEFLEMGIVNPQGETSHVVACDVHRCQRGRMFAHRTHPLHEQQSCYSAENGICVDLMRMVEIG